MKTPRTGRLIISRLMMATTVSFDSDIIDGADENSTINENTHRGRNGVYIFFIEYLHTYLSYRICGAM